MDKKIPVLLDGDPGHDDAIAWVLAKASDRFDIRGVTVVAGNQTLEKVAYNAQRVCRLCGIDAPIAMGSAKPLLCDLILGSAFHGESGLDGPVLPEPVTPLSELSAVELMAKVLREAEEPVLIFATGAQTNVASLLLAHPELKPKIRLISTMGGGITTGNWTPAAEFNILVDPEAAKIVLESGVPVQMSPLDVTERALIDPKDRERIRSVDTHVAKIVAGWLDFFTQHHEELGYAGAPLHDPCAVLSVLHPEIFTIRNLHVGVDTEGQYTRGITLAVPGEANARVVLDVDRCAFVDQLVKYCGTYKEKEHA